MARIIVIGNEKGGSGKTTTAMHLTVSLLNLGFKCATIDLDHRQQSFTHYVENRRESCKKYGYGLKIPDHNVLLPCIEDSKAECECKDEENLKYMITQLANNNDFIIIDTPGNDTTLSRVAHSCANIVITPINDSVVDLDLIGNLNSESLDTKRPGIYSAMFWEQKMKRIKQSREEIGWFVVRNRLSTLNSRNKARVGEALTKLSKKFGFKVAPGFCDRVVFKELFLDGFTLHDARKVEQIRITPSVLSARLELNQFLKSLAIPEVVEKLNKIEESKPKLSVASILSS